MGTNFGRSLSAQKEKTAFILFLVIILVIMPVYLYYGYVTRPSTGSVIMVGDLQIRATSVQVTSLAFGGPDLSLTAVVYNPNGFGVELTGANYSVFADRHFLQDGQITNRYVLASQSTQTFVFPVSISWSSAFQTLGNYIWAWGDVTWEVKGTASLEVGGIHLTVPFDLSTHTT